MIAGFIPIGFVLTVYVTLEWPHLIERNENLKSRLIAIEEKIKNHDERIEKLKVFR